jgi:hypothetical protein
MTTTFQVLAGYNHPAQANGFSDWSCHNIPFADKVCKTVESTNKAVDFMSDPLGYIAQFFNNAVTSLFTQMIKALLSTTTIDWSDPGFLRTYTMAFAASSVLTVFLWLIAVAKRALQGVDPLQAVTESIGYLLISVVVSALAPAAIAYTTELFDQAALAMFMPVAGDAARMVVTVTTAMSVIMSIPGGAVLVMFLALGMLSAVAGVWLELIVRDALIFAGLVFGTTVFSGLVDRNLWSHTKRWVGVMVAVIASKYVTFTTIALATGMLASDSGKPSVGQAFATVFTAIALQWLALYLPFLLSRFLPILGDELAGMYQARDDFKGRAKSVGSAAGDTFGELASRFGGGGGGSASGGGGEAGSGEEGEAAGADGAEMGAEEAGAAATGVGAVAVAAKKGAEKVKDNAEESAEQGTEAATGDSGGGQSDTPGTRPPGGAEPAGSNPGSGAAGSTSDAGEDPSVSGPQPAPAASPAPDASADTPLPDGNDGDETNPDGDGEPQ